MKPHIVIIHRWRVRYASYADYVDHDDFAVSYVTTGVGESGVPPAAAEVALVGATDDLPAVRDRIKLLAARHGAPAAIIALKEDDLLVAAQLREEWGCPGPTREDLIRVRDKLVMLTAVRAAGLAVPAFAPAPSMDAVVGFAAEHGWPVVVKPRIGSSSAGVVLVTSAATEPDFESYGPLLVQAYDPRQIYHVDGFTDGTALGPFRASRYLNSCLDFRHGDVLGSVEEDDPALIASIGAFTEQALAALVDGPTVFHLEVFCDRDTGSCAFLEVGARVGGGEIPFVWQEVHGYDLMEAAFRIALGQPPRPLGTPFREVGGILLVPAPAARPCRVTEVTPMLGTVPGLYAEALLRPGEVIPAADAYYEHVGGRFRFRGGSSAAVEEAVVATARRYRVRAEPVLS